MPRRKGENDAPATDDDLELPGEDSGTGASFFETLMDEVIGDPFVARVGDVELVVEAPTVDAVADLEYVRGPLDVLDLLVPDDEAVFEAVLDVFEDRPASELTELLDDVLFYYAVLNAPPAGWPWVTAVLDTYGEAIEYDLATVARLDLADWFRDHLRFPWAKLKRLVDRLPQGSHFWAAQMANEERAQYVHDLERRGESTRSSRPPLEGWTREVELLTATVDGTRQIQHSTMAASQKVKGKGGKPPRPLPRPKTAIEVIERRAALQRHEGLKARLANAAATADPGDSPVDWEASSVVNARGQTLPASVTRGAVLLGDTDDG